MALILPYPNLDFVPLDVLTAEEMNEIVANYTFVSNQFSSKVATNDQSVALTSAGVIVCTITGLLPGTYAVIGNISHNHGDDPNGDYTLTKINLNGTTIASGRGYIKAGWDASNVVAIGVATITSTSDTLTLVGATQNNQPDSTDNVSALAAIRMS